ncbi:MAG: AraC family transcriptional regulator [Dokdonella sp.]
MAFVQHTPALPLHDSIESIWDWRVAPGEFRLERILPAPGSSLIINLLEDESRVYADDAGLDCKRSAGAVLSGQFTESFVIDTHEQVSVIGVMFKPAGACSFFRERMDLLGNRHTDLEALVGSDGPRLRERLLQMPSAQQRLAAVESWLRRRCTQFTAHAAVGYALDALQRCPQIQRIDALVRDSGLSQRRFSTLFREQIGVGAKQYARMLRFRCAVAHARPQVDWSRVAADCGFHDQPHLNREFRTFSGMTPSLYLARKGAYTNHIALPTT